MSLSDDIQDFCLLFREPREVVLDGRTKLLPSLGQPDERKLGRCMNLELDVFGKPSAEAVDIAPAKTLKRCGNPLHVGLLQPLAFD